MPPARRWNVTKCVEGQRPDVIPAGPVRLAGIRPVAVRHLAPISDLALRYRRWLSRAVEGRVPFVIIDAPAVTR